MAKIGGIIGHINDITTTIATAVEEQSATTDEMARNVTEAAKGSSEIAKNIEAVAQAAETTSAGVTGSQKAAEELAKMSVELHAMVSQFKVHTSGAIRQTNDKPMAQLIEAPLAV